MTRQIPATIAFPILVFVAACGPPPVRPRAPLEPRPEPAAKDAHASPSGETSDAGGSPTQMEDAGPPAAVDSGSARPKLPAPEAGVTAATDAGVETVSARVPALGDILIVEVLVNPAGQDTGREWIEIENQSAEPLDLSGLHVADASIDVAAGAGIIDPGGRVVLGQSADASANGGSPVAVAYGTRLALNNDGEELSICAGACASGVIIDHVGWKTLGDGYDGHALVFDRDANRMCAATQPFGTAGDFGTPGTPDDDCVAPDAGF